MAGVPAHIAYNASSRYEEDRVLDDLVAIRVVAHLVMPFILLYGLYVQFHGEYSPGGGFQAGVICAAAFIIHALSNDIEATASILPARIAFAGTAAGVLIYGFTGVVCMFAGGGFLEYGVLLEDSVAGQHLGMFLIETGVGVTVFSVMVSTVYAFGGEYA